MFKYSPKRGRGTLLSPAFADALSTLIIIFISLFVLTIIRFNEPTKVSSSAKPKAEIMIVIDWPADMDDDVDLWVRDPLGNTVWFSNKESGFLSLDRDDLGKKTDEIQQYKVEINREVVYMRGLIPGEYIVNLHMYTKRESRPTPIKIEVSKIDPYVIFYTGIQIMTDTKQEITAIRFTIDEKGNLLEKNFIYRRLVQLVNTVPLP